MKLGRKDSIGLDWGAGGLKWVKLEPHGDHYKLLYLDTLPLPEQEEKATAVLKEYVVQHQLTGTPVAIGFQDTHLHIRRMELPRMPEEDLKEAIRWQMRDVEEGSIDDYNIQYSLIEEKHKTDSVQLVLLAYAIKKEALQFYPKILQKAGLKPFFLEPIPVATAMVIEQAEHPTEGEWIVAVDIGAKHAYFIAMARGKLHLVRPLVGISEERADSTKLSLEIQRALDALSVSYQAEKIKKLFLMGGGAANPDMAAALSKNLGIVTEIFNPWQGIEAESAFPLAKEKPYLFGAAIGLAMLHP